MVSQLVLPGSVGDQPLPIGQLHRFPRPDLVKKFAEAPHGSPDIRSGFVAHLPQAAIRPAGAVAASRTGSPPATR